MILWFLSHYLRRKLENSLAESPKLSWLSALKRKLYFFAGVSALFLIVSAAAGFLGWNLRRERNGY